MLSPAQWCSSLNWEIPLLCSTLCSCIAVRGDNYALRTFVDAFQGHYKDGTEPGTTDRRWFAGIYFLGRILKLYVIFGAVKNAVGYTLAGFSFMAIGMLIILIKPFKSSKVNTYHSILLFIMATGCFFITLSGQVEMIALWMMKPLVVLVGVSIYHQYWLQ